MKATLVALTLALAACISDGTGPQPVSLTGTWALAMNGGAVIEGTSRFCAADSMNFAITQADSTFTGVQLGAGSLRCGSAQGTEKLATIAGGSIADGVINDADLRFTITPSPGATVAAHVNAGSYMSGTATWNVPAGGVTYTVSGSFTGVRTK